MLKDQVKTWIHELKHRDENCENQMAIFEFIKNKITEIKNSIETLISRLDRANKIIDELKKLLVYLAWFVAL